MKMLLSVLLLFTALLSGCTCTIPGSATLTAKPEEVIRTFIQALNNGDINTCLGLVTEDIYIFDDPPGSKVEGKAQFSTNLQQFSAQNQKFTITSPLVVNGNTVTLSAKVESFDFSIIGLESLKTTMEFQLLDGKIKSWLTKPDPSDWQKVIESTSGGIGIMIETVQQGLRVKDVAKNSPALEAGVRVGDIIIAVNGIAYSQMREGEMTLRIRGPVGSKVVLTIIHEGNTEPVAIEITRADLAKINN